MNHGKDDGVVFKTDAAGNLIWATYYGGSGEDDFMDLTAESSYIYLTGNTNSPTLTVGINNIYSIKINSTDASMVW